MTDIINQTDILRLLWAYVASDDDYRSLSQVDHFSPRNIYPQIYHCLRKAKNINFPRLEWFKHSFNNFMNKKKFKKMSSKAEKFVCDICKKSFKKPELRVHMEIHLSDRIKDHPDSKKCQHCPRFILKENMREHHLKNHKQRKCEECGKCFYSKTPFFAHKRTHKEKRFACEVCGLKLSHKKSLQNHLKSVHIKSAPQSKCEFCDKIILTGSLKKHILNVHEKKFNLNCVVCKKGFPSSIHLRDHLALQHLEQELYKCGICDKSLTTKHGLEKHVREIHEKNVIAKCDNCGKTFVQLSNYKRHLKMHETKPFSCDPDSCGKYFETKEDLEKHLLKRHKKIRKTLS
ncbi:PR domain zinc finger protein 5-like [Culicoides brevitarsis]|uniref:PR domain zinc finger protein 5-like n=1 Tax=Culicoides brevitarsis TaxID=469753 RepID=UPI00307B42D0